MKVTISDPILDNPTLGPLARRASQVLERIASDKWQVVAEWNLVRDSASGQLMQLTLSDSSGARAEAGFPPNEMASEDRLEARLYRVWGDLLQVRSHKQLEMLSGSAQGA